MSLGRDHAFRMANGDISKWHHQDLGFAGERIAEIAEILALGLVRLRARQSSRRFRDGGENSVDFSVDQRRHGAPRANVGDAE